MNLEDVMLNDRNQSQKDKYCTISLIRGIEKSQIHRLKEWNCSCQDPGGGRRAATDQRAYGFS